VTGKRKGKEIEDLSYYQPTSHKKGRSRLTNKTKQIQAPSKLHTKSASKIFPIHNIQLEHVEGARKEIDERREELREENENIQELSQHLKQAQHDIAELYQERRELRRYLEERSIETPSWQS
jgi:uncharacterized coiled-coil DUF342 family protein